LRGITFDLAVAFAVADDLEPYGFGMSVRFKYSAILIFFYSPSVFF